MRNNEKGRTGRLHQQLARVRTLAGEKRKNHFNGKYIPSDGGSPRWSSSFCEKVYWGDGHTNKGIYE